MTQNWQIVDVNGYGLQIAGDFQTRQECELYCHVTGRDIADVSESGKTVYYDADTSGKGF